MEDKNLNIQLAEQIAENKTPYKAYMEVFNEPDVDVARKEVGKKLNRDEDFKECLAYQFKKAGISVDKANRVIKQQLKAKRHIVLSKDSVVKVVDDNTAQLEAAKTVYQLHGLLKNTNTINVDNRKVEFNHVDVNRLRSIAKELKELNEELALDSNSGEVIDI